MDLKILGSNSKGNSYILENNDEALLIECGVKFSEIKKAIKFNISKIKGCIVTHEHQDHCLAINDVLKSGINVFATKGTHQACKTVNHYRSIIETNYFKPIVFGGFKIMAFDVKHDANEPCGFLINHLDSGNVLFLSDTYYSPYTFRDLNNIIVEANYSNEIINNKLKRGLIDSFLKNRIIKSHMSIETCLELLKSNNLKSVNNIVLIHLSDGNSDENYFLNEVKRISCKNVTIAKKGVKINFNKKPF